MKNNLRTMTREEFAAFFEPTGGWYDDATLQKDYEQFQAAMTKMSSWDVFELIVVKR